MKKLIDVYPYRLNGTVSEFLLLKRSEKKIYSGQWRMIGGKVKENETSWQGALRELKEETGQVPVKFWAVPSVNQFYEASSDAIHSIPAFAAELDYNAPITLDEEHTDYKWVNIEEIEPYIKWPEQRRLIKLVSGLLTDKSLGIIPEWLIEVP